MNETLFYAAGPGDVIRTYRHWERGLDDPTEVSVCYSSMFFDVCHRMGLGAYIVSSNQRVEIVKVGQFTLEHRPRKYWSRFPGGYDLAEVVYILSLITTAWRKGSRVAIVANFQHWWVWSLGWLVGIEIVPTLHCAFWPVGFRQRSIKARVVDRLNSWFWRLVPKQTICISPEVQRQLNEMVGSKTRGRAVQARAHYRRQVFAKLAPAPREMNPFRVMFAGRIEQNKGVFDLIEVAARLKQNSVSGFVIELCGSGSAEDELRKVVADRSLKEEVVLHGHLGSSQLQEILGRSHAVVVPTTAAFAEGLSKAAVEAVLAGRPCISSKVCHALEVLGDAIVEVPVGDVAKYAEAIQRLRDNPAEYAWRQAACQRVQEPFYDPESSWGRTLERVLQELGDETRQ